MDAGWLYLLAGAILIAAMVLIAPADDLAQIRHRRDRLVGLESDAIAKLQGYETFLEAIDEADPMLVRRLAAAQLNLVPESSKPIGLIGVELDAHVDHWIRETLPPPTRVQPPLVKDSWLRRLASGPTRLWAILAGAVLVFIGLLPQADAAPAAETHEAVEENTIPVRTALALSINDEAEEEFDAEAWEAEDDEQDEDEAYEDEYDEEYEPVAEGDDDEADEDEEYEDEYDDECADSEEEIEPEAEDDSVADEEYDDPDDEESEEGGVPPQPCTPQPRLIVTETGEVLQAERLVHADEESPRVQVVTISASSVPPTGS